MLFCAPTPSPMQGEFLRVVELQHAAATRHEDDSDMVDAFVACGGGADRGGAVSRDALVRIIKVDFGLTFDIERLLDEQEAAGSSGGNGCGERGRALDFASFKALLLRNPSGARRPS